MPLKLRFKGKLLLTNNDVVNYLNHITKNPRRVTDNFFAFLDKKLQDSDLYNLLFTYQTHREMGFDTKSFLVEMFGQYHMANGCNLLYVLESIDSEDDSYKTFKKEHIKNELEKVNKRIEQAMNDEEDSELGSENHQFNISIQLNKLEEKKELLKKLAELEVEDSSSQPAEKNEKDFLDIIVDGVRQLGKDI
jgi:hypothetical protein